MSDQSRSIVYKKIRSKLPQRKRCRWQLSSPLPCLSLNCAGSAISPEHSWLTGEGVNDAKKLRMEMFSRNRRLDEVSVSGHEASEVTEVSESSSSACHSSSGALNKQENGIVALCKASENDATESFARSEVSSVHQHSPTKSGEFSSKLSQKTNENLEKNQSSVELKENDVVSITSAVEYGHVTDVTSSFSKLQEEETKRNRNRESNFGAPTTESTIDQKPNSVNLKYDSDLTCTEQLTDDVVPDYSSGYDDSFSDLQSEIFLDSSDYDFSTSSLDSGSQFSEKSIEDSTPSHTFALLLQYREQFMRSGTSTLPVGKGISIVNREDKVMNSGFGDEEVAVSYLMLRNRERGQLRPWNYDEYSECIINQRSRMVHWIIEKSRAVRLQKETLFLAVSIFDRFLGMGSFKSNRNFQVAGIACLTLATRIEENQPYNSVRQMVFAIGSNIYRRCEVVAMEWLVLEVLSFQCSPPTVYNFLWYYLKAARADDKLKKKVKDLGELALMDHEHLCYWPSTVAASIVMLACCEDAAAQQVIITTHVRTQDDDLPKCIESLQWLMKYIS